VDGMKVMVLPHRIIHSQFHPYQLQRPISFLVWWD
jgi:hypothetical protein